MTLRLATQYDKESVVKMAIDFYNNSPYKGMAMDGVKVVRTVSDIISSPNSICLLAVDQLTGTPYGVIAGHTSEAIFSSERMASEIIWWVEPEHRGKPSSFALLDAFEYWAKNIQKCKYVQMSLLSDATGQRLGKFYKNRGYTTTEVAYIKEI